MRFDEFLGSGTQTLTGRWCTQREYGNSPFHVICISASCLFLSCVLNNKAISINWCFLDHHNFSNKWHSPSIISSRPWVYSQWLRRKGDNLEWIISIWSGSCREDWVLSQWNRMLTRVDGATIVLIYVSRCCHHTSDMSDVMCWGKCVFYWRTGKCVFYWRVLWDWQVYGESSGS